MKIVKGHLLLYTVRTARTLRMDMVFHCVNTALTSYTRGLHGGDIILQVSLQIVKGHLLLFTVQSARTLQLDTVFHCVNTALTSYTQGLH